MLSAENLTLRRGPKTLCTDLSLHFKPGERWAILGPNGCGKSTLLHALAGLHPPQTGQVLLNKQPLTHISAKAFARKVGLLFQDSVDFFPASVKETLVASRYPYQDTWQLRLSTDDKLAIERAIASMALDSLLRRQLSSLSGGERRRVALACLLVQHPSVYLLDEPLNHLDVSHQIQALQIFKALDPTKLVILVAHDINLAKRSCDHALLLFQDGTHLHGKMETVLTGENLSRLYQHPFTAIKNAEETVWLPA